MTSAPHPSPDPGPDSSEGTAPIKRRALGEWVIAVVLLGLGVVVLRDGLSQPESRSASGVGAGFLPEIVGVLVMALAVALMGQLARGHYGSPDEGEGDIDIRTTHWLPVAGCVAAVVFFIAAVETLGYPVTAAVSFWITACSMGARKHLRNAAISILLVLAIYLLFTKLLGIDLPAGVLEGVL